jgi:multiple sugar transport system ATP-binding protein
MNVIFTVHAPPVVTVQTKAAEEDSAAETGIPLIGSEGTSTFTARVDPRSQARAGSKVRLLIDPDRFHFFDPQTSDAVLPKHQVGLAS